jgi:hypothetical protein
MLIAKFFFIFQKDLEVPYYNQQVQALIDEELKKSDESASETFLRTIPSLLSEEELNSIINRIEQVYYYYVFFSFCNVVFPQRAHHGSQKLKEFNIASHQALSATDSSSLPEWDIAIKEMQQQLMYQENAMLNLELYEQYQSKHFLNYNSNLEHVLQTYIEDTKNSKKQIHGLQRQRKEIQENLLKQLHKLNQTKINSIHRSLQCQVSFHQLKDYLDAKGFSYEQYLVEEEENRKRKERVFDPIYNSTIREYEKINEVIVEDGSDDDEMEQKKKKAKL